MISTPPINGNGHHNKMPNSPTIEEITKQLEGKTEIVPNHNELLKKTFEDLKKRKKEIIVFSKPIIAFDKDPVIFPNTINIIQGKKGQHKSRLSEHLVSAMMSNREVAGFRKIDDKEYMVLLIDTERNLREQLPYAIQSILRIAGYDKKHDPPEFIYTSLIEIERESRFQAVDEFIRDTIDENANKNIFIVLDVMTDLIVSFNDVRESLKLIDLVNNTINKTNSTFVCVIHENPNSDTSKARGHLGTEIVNKASTVMSVSIPKANEDVTSKVIQVKFLHNRMTSTLKPIYMVFDEEKRMLKPIDPKEFGLDTNQSRYSASTEDVRERLIKIISQHNNKMHKKELFENAGIDFLKDSIRCGSKTVSKRFKEIVNIDFQHEGVTKQFVEHTDGKKYVELITLEL